MVLATKLLPPGHVVGVQVYDDGDIALKLYNERPKGFQGELYFDDTQALTLELEGYGAMEDEIQRALEELETKGEATI